MKIDWDEVLGSVVVFLILSGIAALPAFTLVILASQFIPGLAVITFLQVWAVAFVIGYVLHLLGVW